MASMNIMGLIPALEKAKDSIESAVKTLDDLSKDVLQFDGEIARVLPLNLKQSMDALIEIVEGDDQSSLKKLAEYLNTCPLSAFRDNTQTKKFDPLLDKNTSGKTGMATADQYSQIDTTPRGSKPASAVINDSILDKYLKRKPQLSESSSRSRTAERARMSERAHKLSLELTFDDEEIGVDLDPQYVDDGEDNVSVYNDMDIDDGDQFLEDDDGFDSASWQDLASGEDEEVQSGLNFDDVMANEEIGSGDDDDLLSQLGAFNAKTDIPVEPMQKVKHAPVAAPLNNQDEFIPEDEGEPEDHLGNFDGSDDDIELTEFDASVQPTRQGQGAQPRQAQPVQATDWRALAKSDMDLDFSKIAGK